MNTSTLIRILTVILGMITSSLSANDTPLRLFMSCSPENPIVGEKVTWCMMTFGGGNYQYTWNADSTEIPKLYDWPSGGEYPFKKITAVSAIYTVAGTKSVTVGVSSKDKSTTRTLSVNVADGRITLLSPAENTVWEVGKTYKICWKTEGIVPTVQIGLWDHRYPSEISDGGGEEILAQEIPNVGFFNYTVPLPRINGISTGNLGGKNYKISIGGFGNCVGDFSNEAFIIRVPKKKDN
jgi:hypothetical protein